MPWNKQDYPDSFKNLDEPVREKAIEIANALLRDGYEDNRAIPIALDRAREYVHGGDGGARPVYEVREDGEEWVLRKKGSGRAILREDTKDVLLEKAKPRVNDQNGILNIYKGDGELEDTLYES
ncbi:DUF2188 domain-containing protein [Bhargavaea beijingensis]|uniref:Uncharacterized protein conserved in bacteria n=1 Tax=Bhargavaea beijingensis TaxID=426756 RepID=A0A1G7G053_9BACL|nr:DUF2188 domain-containing protein [Bhargavaea beijingensis]MCW1927758.1 DUF2188 domain-containing protein [Bhargavaea beijingensis]SDE81420.1 Uncharacterized protein conserved in bacteria [Bhargavaea beijingensis]